MGRRFLRPKQPRVDVVTRGGRPVAKQSRSPINVGVGAPPGQMLGHESVADEGRVDGDSNVEGNGGGCRGQQRRGGFHRPIVVVVGRQLTKMRWPALSSKSGFSLSSLLSLVGITDYGPLFSSGVCCCG
mmetsp:Transcript_4765/g.13351  ORF Transcript_4765/g.13351 Transcript_4765/m.13351 type:complete len:129 (+) Transcript_4765:497-883(+)